MIYRVIVGGSRPITLEVEIADGLEPPASVMAQMGAAAGLHPVSVPPPPSHGRMMGSKPGHPVDQAISSEDMYGG